MLKAFLYKNDKIKCIICMIHIMILKNKITV